MMEFRTLLLINAVIAIPVGIACILAPAQLLGTYGVMLPPMGLVVYQFWGAFLLGLGMLTWSVRKTEERGAQRAIASSLTVTYGISCAIAVRGQLSGANNMGWSTVALFLLLALGFAYLRFSGLRSSLSGVK